MQQIQQQINLFHTLFYVCLGLSIFCLVLSIFFFFKFDIRNIFNARTGRSVKKTVQRVEEMNAKTGPLRRPVGRGNTGTLSRSGNLGKSRKLSGVRQVNTEDIIQPPSQPTEPLSNAYTEEAGAAEVLHMEKREALTPEKAQQEACSELKNASCSLIQTRWSGQMKDIFVYRKKKSKGVGGT